jgi:U11/U12 small nuclear ribonucleoprotein 65 kDa protein
METVYSTSIESTSQGFGRLEPMQSSQSVHDNPVQEQEPLPLIPLADIVKHRLSEEQLHLLDNGRLYRNYQRGSPSQRLYIKNLNSKHVDERILHSIYDRYSEQSSPVDIRLLRDGKMKGQAFVSFASVELATRALADTNGFMLHEKPMIVQFARSAIAKDSV